MAALSKANATAVFDLKSAALTVLAVVLKTTDLAVLAQAMRERFNEAPGFFDNEPACIDLSAVRHEPAAPDFAELLQLLRHHGLNPVAVRGGSPEQMAAGLAAGLAEAPDPLPPARAQPEAPPALSIVPAAQPEALGIETTSAETAPSPAESEGTPARLAKTGGVLELVLRVPLLSGAAAAEAGDPPSPDGTVLATPAAASAEPPPAQPAAAEPVVEPALEISTLDAGEPAPTARQVEELGAQALQPLPTAAGKLMPTLIYDKPLRSGQRIYARGSDLVVLGVVNFGAEVIADGSIHVYAPLRGRAIAGACGDVNARIFALSMKPQLVSIAGNWRTIEDGAFPEADGKMAQVRLEGEKLLLEPIKG